VQGAVPEQPPPPQPVKTASLAGVAVRVTVVPAPRSLEQVPEHEIEPSSLVTEPEPVPATLTVSIWPRPARALPGSSPAAHSVAVGPDTAVMLLVVNVRERPHRGGAIARVGRGHGVAVAVHGHAQRQSCS
jgi:hypothetical protein